MFRHLAAVVALAALGCAAPEDDFDLACETCDQPADELRRRMGTIFQIDHFTVEVNAYTRSVIRTEPPGSIVFWNSNRVGAEELREVIRSYSEAAITAGTPPILFSTDYEGGGLRPSHTFRSIPGVQRFTDGFTALAHPRWIGKAYRADPERGRELARLHGEIMARELASVGINYPLSVVSDLAQQLFVVRGIDSSAERVGTLIGDVLDGAATEPSMVLATKHFPGLGQVSSDTHDDLVVSPIRDAATSETHLAPFRTIVDHAAETGVSDRLSILCSHAKFPFYDPDNNTTTSPIILQSLLRDEVGFDGIALSDAMWMGRYYHLSGDALYRVYFHAFVSGLDMLMIPAARYSGALSYFRSALDGTLDPSEILELEAAMDMSWSEINAEFRRRLEQSLERIDRVRRGLPHAADTMAEPGAVPTNATVLERNRYYEILEATDSRWTDYLN